MLTSPPRGFISFEDAFPPFVSDNEGIASPQDKVYAPHHNSYDDDFVDICGITSIEHTATHDITRDIGRLPYIHTPLPSHFSSVGTLYADFTQYPPTRDSSPLPNIFAYKTFFSDEAIIEALMEPESPWVDLHPSSLFTPCTPLSQYTV